MNGIITFCILPVGLGVWQYLQPKTAQEDAWYVLFFVSLWGPLINFAILAFVPIPFEVWGSLWYFPFDYRTVLQPHDHVFIDFLGIPIIGPIIEGVGTMYLMMIWWALGYLGLFLSSILTYGQTAKNTTLSSSNNNRS